MRVKGSHSGKMGWVWQRNIVEKY